MTGEPQDRVELHPSYVWDCDHCGAENFFRAVIRQLTVEEARMEVGAAFSGSDDSLVSISKVPYEVTCRECGTRFRPEFSENFKP